MKTKFIEAIAVCERQVLRGHERNGDGYGVSLPADELNLTVKFARPPGISSEICNTTWATVLP